MTSKGRSNLDVNGKGWDDFVFDNSKPIVQYKPIGRKGNNVVEVTDVYPTQRGGLPAYGSTIFFELDGRYGDYLGPIDFSYTRSAELSGIVTGGGTCRFEDFEGYSSIEYVKVYMENQDGFTEFGDAWLQELLAQEDETTRQIQSESQFGYLMPFERQNLTAAQQTVTCKLRLPFERLEKHLPLHALSGKVNIEIKFKNLPFCCFSSGTPNFTITNPILRIRSIHEPLGNTDQDYKAVHVGGGVGYKMVGREFHRGVLLTPGQTQYRIRLDNLKNSQYLIRIIIRNQSDVYGGSSTLNTFNFQRCSRYWLENAGTQITQKYEMNDLTAAIPDYGSHMLAHRMFPFGQKGLYFGYIPFIPEEDVRKADDFSGGKYFAALSNPELVMQWDAGLTNATVVDIWGMINQVLVVEKGIFHTHLKQ
jgi:hypothetical protein